MHFWPGTEYHKFAFRCIWSSTKASQAACDSLQLIFCFPFALHCHSPRLAHLPTDILKAEEIKYIQNTIKQHILLWKKIELATQLQIPVQIHMVCTWAVFQCICRWHQFGLFSLHSREKENCGNHFLTFMWTQIDQARFLLLTSYIHTHITVLLWVEPSP